MSVWTAWNDGWRRALRARSIVIALWLVTLLVALPAALTLYGMLAHHLGASLAADAAAAGVNLDWWNEFLAQTSGLGQTFVPSILGFSAVLRNLNTVADARPVPLALIPIVGTSLILTVFLLGGVLDRLARDRAIGTNGFFAACGVFFFRFLRLGVIAGAVYWLMFAVLHPWLFRGVYSRLIHDVTVERTAFVYRVTLYLVFAALLLLVNLLFDYAKIRMIVEDRRSALAALTAAIRFISRHPGAAIGLYLLNTLIFAVILMAYALVAPGAAGGPLAWIALLLGQLFIVLRIIARLTFAASQIALFQSRLAHAGYTARPVPAWPDSPAADAIAR